MRFRASALATVSTVAALTLAACGGASPTDNAGAPSAAPPPPPASPAPDPKAEAMGRWMNDFCGALKPLASLADQKNPTVKPKTAAEARKAVGDYLDKVENSVGPVVDGLSELPPAPQPAGDDAKTSVIELFKPVRDKAESAKEKLDQAADSDTKAITDANTRLQESVKELQAAATKMSDAKGVREAQAAGKGQPNCQVAR